MKILLIEDNELNLDMLTRRLERKGFTVISAIDGLSGIEKANQEKPKLIIMDLSLPILDGWGAAKKLKADNVTKSIPIIALACRALIPMSPFIDGMRTYSTFSKESILVGVIISK